jgi:hypothetical protein
MKQTIAHLDIGFALFLAIFASQALAQTPIQVPGASTKFGPAVATDGNYAYIAWVDSSTSDVHFATFSTSSLEFGTGVPVRGTNSDGTTWTARSGATPAWSYDGLSFYLIWKGLSDNNLWWSVLSDGVWSQQQLVEGTDPNWTAGTSVGPAASFSNWPVTAYWKGASSSKVWTSTLDYLQSGWSTQAVDGGLSTKVTPGIESAPNTTVGYTIFLTNTSNDIVGAGYPVSGTDPDWTAESTYGPAATVDGNGNDVVFWKGLSSTSIWYSYNTGTPLGSGGPPLWSHQATVSGANANTDQAPSVANGNGPYIPMMILAWKKAGASTVWYMDADMLPEMARASQQADKP